MYLLTIHSMDGERRTLDSEPAPASARLQWRTGTTSSVLGSFFCLLRTIEIQLKAHPHHFATDWVVSCAAT